VSSSINNVVILGLGLIGGSLARSLRETGFANHFIGCGHREPSLKRGLELGVIDEFTLDIDEAFERADIMVICAPTLKAGDILQQILPRMGEEGAPIVTDVASVKGNLLEIAQNAPQGFPPNLVLGHPIAGSERSGVEASNAGLFQNHRVILTPREENTPESVSTVRAMWESTGANVVDMSVKAHDQVLAATSHLPHVLAYSLVDALASSDDSDAVFACAAGGFRDFTRIASSDPVMWRDIALANRDALLEAIDTFDVHLKQLRTAVADGKGEELEATFSRAKKARDDFAQSLSLRDGKK
jgi:prephenate dehydrogenase